MSGSLSAIRSAASPTLSRETSLAERIPLAAEPVVSHSAPHNLLALDEIKSEVKRVVPVLSGLP